MAHWNYVWRSVGNLSCQHILSADCIWQFCNEHVEHWGLLLLLTSLKYIWYWQQTLGIKLALVPSPTCRYPLKMHLLNLKAEFCWEIRLSSDLFCPVWDRSRLVNMGNQSHMSSRVRLGGVYGGRRAWAELLPVGPLGRLWLWLGQVIWLDFEAMPTEPDVRDFL